MCGNACRVSSRIAMANKKLITGDLRRAPLQWGNILPIGVFLLGCLCTGLLWKALDDRRSDFAWQKLSIEQLHIKRQVESALDTRLKALERMARRWAMQGGIAEEIWSADARLYVTDFQDLVALNWLDSDYILRGVESSRSTVNKIGEPTAGSERVKQEFSSIIENLQTYTSSPFLFNEEFQLVYIVPLSVDGKFDGFLSALINLTILFSNALQASIDDGYVVGIYDGESEIFLSSTETPDIPAANFSENKVIVGSNELIVRVWPGRSDLQNLSNTLSQAILVFGFLISGGLAYIVALARRSSKQNRNLILANRKLEGINFALEKSEMHLKESRDLLQATFDNFPGGITIYDKDLMLVAANSGFYELQGLPEELCPIGSKMEDLIRLAGQFAKRTESEIETLVQRAFNSIQKNKDRPWQFEQRRPGTNIVLETRTYPIPGGGLVSMHTDITQRKMAEKSLKDSRDLLQATFDNFPGGIAVYDKDLILVAANSTHFELENLPQDEFPVGSRMEDMIRRGVALHSDDEEFIERITRNTITAIKKDKDKPTRYERRIPGSDIISETRTFPMPDGGLVSMHIDITQRKRAEESLKESRDHLRAVFDNFLGGISIIDADLNFIDTNDLFYDLLKLPKDEFPEGSKYEDIVRYLAKQGWYGEGDVEDMVRARIEQFRANQTEHIERTVPDGRTIEMRCLPLPSGGIVRTYVDVTQRKKAEESLRAAKDAAESADRAKTEFLANMSHELRTPLNAIIGFSKIMISESLGPIGNRKYWEYSNDIHESGNHLLGIINDILDISKVEANQLKLDDDIIDVPGLIDSTVKLVRESAAKNGVDLHLDLADDLPRLLADERSVKQILLNLLSNAVKFTPSGGSVTTKVWSDASTGYVIEVIDTGIGMTPEHIAKALTLFGQVDGSLQRQFEGTGLGLPLTKSLVELHGGTLDVQSQVGVGTLVTVCFPRKRIVANITSKIDLQSA